MILLDDYRLVGRQLHKDRHIGLAQDWVKAPVAAVLAAARQHLRRAVDARHLMACLEERDEEPRSGGRFQDRHADIGEQAGVVIDVGERVPDGLVEWPAGSYTRGRDHGYIDGASAARSPC